MKLDIIATDARRNKTRKGRQERAWRHSETRAVPEHLRLVNGNAPEVRRMRIR